MTPAIGQRVWYTDKQGRGHLAIVGGVHYIRDEVTTVNLATHMDAPVLYNVPYSPEYAPNSYADKEPPQAAPVQPAQDRPAVPPHKLTLGAVVWFTDVDGRGQEARVTALQWDGPRSTPTARLSVGNRDVDDVKYSPLYLPRSFHPVAPRSRAPHHSCGPTMREHAREHNAWRTKVRGMTDALGRVYPPVHDQGALGSCSTSDVRGEHHYTQSRLQATLDRQQPPAGGRLETPGGMPLELAHQMARREPEMSDVSPKPDPDKHAQEERERQYAESLHDRDTRIAQLASYLEKNTAVMAQDAETIRSLQDKLRHPVSSRPVLAHHIDWESLYLTDGGGGGEPDTISLGHDAEGTWRSAEIAGYQGTDAREHLEYVLKVARGIGAALDALLGE